MKVCRLTTDVPSVISEVLVLCLELCISVPECEAVSEDACSLSNDSRGFSPRSVL